MKAFLPLPNIVVEKRVERVAEVDSPAVNTLDHPENVLNGQTALCSDLSYFTALDRPIHTVRGGGGGAPLSDHLVLGADAGSHRRGGSKLPLCPLSI